MIIFNVTILIETQVIKGYHYFMKKLTTILYLSITVNLITSCMQATNSNSSDDSLYSSNTITDPKFKAAFEVLNTKCANCHSGYHNNWSNYTNASDWQNSNLVIANDIANSDIIVRLDVWGATGGMPKDASPLTESEYNSLKDWINNL